MSVKEVNPLHSRYIELTARFKACWTFHRFQAGLQKFFGRRDLEVVAFDFQSLYKRLRATSLLINSGAPKSVERELDAVAHKLEEVVESLDNQDAKVSPSLLRLFFQRVKAYDERILIEMVRFYQEAQSDRSWSPDRIDKVDFLISRLAETVAGANLSGDRPRLEKILQRLSDNVELGDVDPRKVDIRVKLIQTVLVEANDVDSLEDLTQLDLVNHYRDLKHSLGRLFFQRSVLPRIVETNSALSAMVESLSRREEERIFADYERISQLERAGSVGGEILDVLNHLHTQVSGFRKQVKTGNVRLAELAELRTSLAMIDSLLAQEVEIVREPSSVATRSSEETAAYLAFQLPELFISAEARELISPSLRQLGDALAQVDPEAAAETVASTSAVVPFRLEPREVTAYRRLASGANCNERLEGFLLTAAALRHRINLQVGKIHDALNADPGNLSPISSRDQRTLQLGDWYLRQFSHFLEGELLGERPAHAKQIRRCEMRLMRDFSGLWLEAQRLG